MRIVPVNFLDQCEVAASARIGFPATNVQHAHLSKQWRSLTGVASIVFDAGSGLIVTANTVYVAGHNLTASALVRVQANDVDDWSAPPVDEALTWRADILVGYVSIAHRFVRFTFDALLSYVAVGRLGAGLYSQLQPQLEGIKDYPNDTTVAEDGPSGQTFANLGVVAQVYEVPLGQDISAATRTLVKSIYDAVGQHTPFLLLVDELDLVTFPPLYCRLTVAPAFTHSGAEYWHVDPLVFKESF